jgi:hypothetical protein
MMALSVSFVCKERKLCSSGSSRWKLFIIFLKRELGFLCIIMNNNKYHLKEKKEIYIVRKEEGTRRD